LLAVAVLLFARVVDDGIDDEDDGACVVVRVTPAGSLKALCGLLLKVAPPRVAAAAIAATDVDDDGFVTFLPPIAPPPLVDDDANDDDDDDDDRTVVVGRALVGRFAGGLLAPTPLLTTREDDDDDVVVVGMRVLVLLARGILDVVDVVDADAGRLPPVAVVVDEDDGTTRGARIPTTALLGVPFEVVVLVDEPTTFFPTVPIRMAAMNNKKKIQHKHNRT
jgi:hypothetical protein